MFIILLVITSFSGYCFRSDGVCSLKSLVSLFNIFIFSHYLFRFLLESIQTDRKKSTKNVKINTASDSNGPLWVGTHLSYW